MESSRRRRQQSSHKRRLRARTSRGHGASFIDEIVTLQQQRQLEAPTTGSVQVFDRSPVCTLALATYLGWPVSQALAAELARITSEGIYERQVLFIRNLGFCEPTPARRISFRESLVFERIHEQSYRTLGYQLIDIPPVTSTAVSHR